MALAAKVQLRWQRLAGENEALVAHLARVSPDQKIRELAESLTDTRAAWSRQVNVPEPNPKAIAMTRGEVESMEVKLAGLSRAFKAQWTNRNLEWRQVAGALPVGSAFLSLRGVPGGSLCSEAASGLWLAQSAMGGAGVTGAWVAGVERSEPPACIAKEVARKLGARVSLRSAFDPSHPSRMRVCDWSS